MQFNFYNVDIFFEYIYSFYEMSNSFFFVYYCVLVFIKVYGILQVVSIYLLNEQIFSDVVCFI